MRGFALRRIGRLGLVALAMVLGMSAAPMAGAADVVLRVDGLACPFCAFGIEKKLLDVPAVDGMDIQLNEGMVSLRLRDGERLDPAALDRAVGDAGFTLRKILVRDAIGTLSRTEEGEFLLRCSQPLIDFALRFDAEDALPGLAPTPGVTRVEVSGEFTEYGAEPVPLAVTSLHGADEPAGGPR